MSKRINVERSLPNSDLLHTQLVSALSDKYLSLGSGSQGIYVVLDDAATVADEALARNTVLNHDETQFTPNQQRNVEKRILFEQVNARFLEEVIKETPDWLACYDDIGVMISGQDAVVNALNNIIGLTNNVFLLTGIVVGSNRAKQQQLLTFIQVLSLWGTAV